ncbi:MAG: asparaginase [Spirochaetia bacterium]|nr:asparaginase [Spirochaetia bacterium]
MEANLRLIITGGTFDKEYDELQGDLTFKDTHIPEILKFVHITVPVTLEICHMKDSLFMDDKDREHILLSCIASEQDRIIITHGTDTMVKTAELLGKGCSREKTIVLTGAMVPYSIRNSDAMFNLGSAVSAVQLLESGVYICMNGTVFTWNNVRKNTQLGVFEKIRP